MKFLYQGLFLKHVDIKGIYELFEHFGLFSFFMLFTKFLGLLAFNTYFIGKKRFYQIFMNNRNN